MSHTATMTYGTLERIAPDRQIAQRKPIGLLPTVAWSAAAMLAIFWVPLAEMAVQVWNPGFRMPTLLSFYIPCGHIAAGLVVAAAVWFSGRSFSEYLAVLPLRTRDVFAGIGFGVLGFIMMAAIFVGLALLQQTFGTVPAPGPGLPKLPINLQTMLFAASLWTLMVVAAPFVEEFLFRGLMFRGLAESALGVTGAIVISSVVFGLAHMPGFGWHRVVATGAVGLMFALMRWRTGNSSITIVAHATTNFMGFSVMMALLFA